MYEDLDKVIRSSGAQITDGKIKFPAFVKRIKVDVGLSRDAVQSLQWLRSDPQLAVIGFEPLQENIAAVRKLVEEEDSSLYLKERFLILPLALADFEGEHEFYVTDIDAGSSSLFKPVSYKLREVTRVNTTTLHRFLDYVDFFEFSQIDYLKTDCQGADFRVILGAKDLIVKFAIVTVEADGFNYLGAGDNSESTFDNYMSTLGFFRLNPRTELRKQVGKAFSGLKFVDSLYRLIKKFFPTRHSSFPSIHVDDPTYINKRHIDQIKMRRITAYQRG